MADAGVSCSSSSTETSPSVDTLDTLILARSVRKTGDQRAGKFPLARRAKQHRDRINSHNLVTTDRTALRRVKFSAIDAWRDRISAAIASPVSGVAGSTLDVAAKFPLLAIRLPVAGSNDGLECVRSMRRSTPRALPRLRNLLWHLFAAHIARVSVMYALALLLHEPHMSPAALTRRRRSTIVCLKFLQCEVSR